MDLKISENNSVINVFDKSNNKNLNMNIDLQYAQNSSVTHSQDVGITPNVNSNDFKENTYARNILKIGSLNVCGLKTRVKYPEFIRLVEEYSILCLSEIKVDEYDVFYLPNYTFFVKT